MTDSRPPPACRRSALYDPWIKIVREGDPGTECLIDSMSLEAGYARLCRGELPPLMPKKRKALEARRKLSP